MLTKLHFALVLLLRYKNKHLLLFFLMSFLVSVVSSVFFISSSLQKDIAQTLDAQADITLQRFEAGRVLNAPQSWVDDALDIEGVSQAQGRVYGMHFYEPLEEYFLVYGVDLYDTQVVQELQKVVDTLDTEKFLERKNMLIGSGVKRFFDEFAYTDYYIFRPPDRSREKIYIYGVLDKQTDVLSNDMVLMSMQNAKKVLGVEDDFVTDVVIKVANPKELTTIVNKLKMLHFNVRIITKEDIQRYYKNIFNYKGGLFLALYIVTLLSFMLILYQRYSLTKSDELQEVAILRLSGWKIDEIVWLKLFENFVVVVSAFMSGVMVAFVYVEFFGGGVLQALFLGDENLHMCTSLSVDFDSASLFGLFLFFTLPYLGAVVLPLYRATTKDAMEILR